MSPVDPAWSTDHLCRAQPNHWLIMFGVVDYAAKLPSGDGPNLWVPVISELVPQH